MNIKEIENAFEALKTMALTNIASEARHLVEERITNYPEETLEAERLLSEQIVQLYFRQNSYQEKMKEDSSGFERAVSKHGGQSINETLERDKNRSDLNK